MQAADYFYKRLEKCDLDVIFQIAETLENALISTFFIESNLIAAKAFEYQNNRGKDLTDFEIIKGYLIQQLYEYNDEKTATRVVETIQKEYISKIYRHIEFVDKYFSEKELLNDCCYLYCNGKDGEVESIKNC